MSSAILVLNLVTNRETAEKARSGMKIILSYYVLAFSASKIVLEMSILV